MPFDSSLEKKFAEQTNFIKNEKRFVIFESTSSKKIRITYKPDFIYIAQNKVNENLVEVICWIEVKGYHKNMNVYLLKRRLITAYCIGQHILFLEFRYKKKLFFCSFTSNKFLN